LQALKREKSTHVHVSVWKLKYRTICEEHTYLHRIILEGSKRFGQSRTFLNLLESFFDQFFGRPVEVDELEDQELDVALLERSNQPDGQSHKVFGNFFGHKVFGNFFQEISGSSRHHFAKVLNWKEKQPIKASLISLPWIMF